MNMKKLFFLLITTTLLFASCGDDDNSNTSIVGTWELEKYSASAQTNKSEFDLLLSKFIVREFSANGKEYPDETYTITFNNDKTYVIDGSKGTYKIVNNILTMTPDKIDEDNDVAIFQYVLDNDKLTLIIDKTNELKEYYTNEHIGENIGADLEGMIISKASLNLNLNRIK